MGGGADGAFIVVNSTDWLTDGNRREGKVLKAAFRQH